MTQRKRRARAVNFCMLLTSAVLFLGCAGRAPVPAGNGDSHLGTAQERTLVIAFHNESVDLAGKIPNAVSSGQKALFNAALVGVNHEAKPERWLAEEVPQLNTDSWRVFPDGQMETTYRLRPGLTWHDGHPLTADDFVFAWQVYADSRFGVFTPEPQNRFVAVTAPDPRSIVIRWGSLYGEADILGDNSAAGTIDLPFFPALPEHILGQPFAEYQQDPSKRDAFLRLPFWTTEYVGLGAYRLNGWEPGHALYADAFAGYVFGRPKIDHIIARIIVDENAVLANLLAGEIQTAISAGALRFEQGLVLEREWSQTNRGTVIFSWTANGQNIIVSFRPEYQKTPALFDVRVRKAINYAIDRQALQDGLFDGRGAVGYTSVQPDETFFPALDRVITKYPFDPRRTEGLMNEAGLSKDSQGFFADRAGERFRPDYRVGEAEILQRGQAIIADSWARAGIDSTRSVITAAQQRELANRNTFPGMGQKAGLDFTAAQIGTPENRWAGANLGAYINPDYEALAATLSTTLGRPARDQVQVQMWKLVSEDLPSMFLYFNPQLIANAAPLQPGPRFGGTFWSVHEWELH